MEKLFTKILFAIVWIGINSCCPSALFAKNFLDVAKGETLYTQFSFFYEKKFTLKIGDEGNRHKTTNYRKGTLVPINTPVTFLKAKNDEIVVSIAGKKVTIVNVSPFSGEEIQGIFNRTFAKSPVNLDSFSDEEKQNILCGNVTIGMSKQAVILALGYPPKHKTPTLNLPQWRYWRSKFGTFLVHFTDDKVCAISGKM